MQGDWRGGREAPLLTDGQLPPQLAVPAAKKVLSQEGTEVFGSSEETSLPRRALRAEHSLDLHPVIEVVSSCWASLLTTR